MREKLSSVITVRKRDLIASVVAARSNSVSILLENVHDEGNEGAVLRSMDALGCLSLHKLTTKSKLNMPHSPKKFKSQPRTDVGARCWVEVHQWSNTEECISTLKQRYGYSLATASPKAPTSIADIDFEQKWLIAFGNETEGISEELSELSDVQFSLPMCGFVESFNVSVSVALTLYHAYLYRISKHVRSRPVSCITSNLNCSLLFLAHWR